MTKLIVDNIGHHFKSDDSSITTLDRVSFECQEGEILSIVGPSGCGKSTLLSLIAGLNVPTAGSIYVDGEKTIKPHPKMGFIFQKNTLLPWRTAKENVELGLEFKGVAESERESIALYLLQKYGLEGFENRYPHALSGGMQKRVSILQTLAYQPELILVDEAFSALDAQTRILVQDEFLKICREMNKTVIMVTHDITEAISMSDKIVVLSTRPGTVKSEHNISFSETINSVAAVRSFPEFPNYYKEIWDEIDMVGEAL